MCPILKRVLCERRTRRTECGRRAVVWIMGAVGVPSLRANSPSSFASDWSKPRGILLLQNRISMPSGTREGKRLMAVLVEVRQETSIFIPQKLRGGYG
jgi:hypothetical protein